jgi:hypothetical protein
MRINLLHDQQLLAEEARVPDKGYQQLLNSLELGIGHKTDAQLVLSKENLKAVKKLVFNQIEIL